MEEKINLKNSERKKNRRQNEKQKDYQQDREKQSHIKEKSFDYLEDKRSLLIQLSINSQMREYRLSSNELRDTVKRYNLNKHEEKKMFFKEDFT